MIDVAEQAKDFDKMHGGRGARIRLDGHFIFPDGARRDCNPLGAYYEVPADPAEVIRCQLAYQQAALELAIEAFYQLRDQIVQIALAAEVSADSIHGKQPDEKLEQLKQLQTTVREKKQTVVDMHNKLTKLKQGQSKSQLDREDRIRERMQQRAQAQADGQELRRRINEIKI